MLFLFTLLLGSHFSHAALIDRCGIYQVEGFLTLKTTGDKKSPILLLEKNSQSEIEIEVDGAQLDQVTNDIGTNINADIFIPKACNFICHGILKKINFSLEPYNRSKPFLFPKTNPKIEMPCVIDKQT